MTRSLAPEGETFLRTCVLYNNSCPEQGFSEAFVATNPAHEMHIVQMLCVHYGWVIGTDLELLPPKSFFSTEDGVCG